LVDSDVASPAKNGPEPPPGPVRAKASLQWAWRWFLRLCCGLLVVLVLLGAALFFLPTVVSTAWFRARLEAHVTNTLQRPVRVDALKWTWSEGITLEGLHVADDPAFSPQPLLSLKEAAVFVDMGRLIQGDLIFDVTLTGADIHFIREAGGRSNMAFLFERKGKRETTRALLFFPLSGDVRGSIQVKGFSLHLEDRALNRRLEIREGSAFCNVPSLFHRPLTLKMDMEGTVQGEALPPIHLEARVSDFITKRALTLKEASLSLQGRFPGLRLEVKGGLGDRALEGKVQTDLDVLAGVVAPFVPSPLPEFSGALELTARLSGDPGSSIGFATRLMGTGLCLRSGPLKGLGPLGLAAIHRGEVDLTTGTVTVEKGEFQIQERSRLVWRGQVTGLQGAVPFVDLSLGPLNWDLKELLGVAEKLLPSWLRLSLKEKGGEGVIPLTLEGLSVKGPVSEGRIEVKVADLSLRLPPMEVDLPGGRVRVEDMALHASSGSMDLDALFPSRVGISLDMRCGSLLYAGARAVRLDRMELFSCRLDATDLALSPRALFGVKGVVTLRERAAVKGLGVDSFAEIPELSQSLEVRCVMDSAPWLDVHAERITLSAPALELKEGFGSPVKAGIDVAAEGFAKKLTPSSKALLGLAGTMAFRESGTITGLGFPSLGKAPVIEHALEAECQLGPGGPALFHVKGLSLTAPTFYVQGLLKEPLEKGLGLKTRLKGVRLHSLKPLRVDVDRGTASLTVEDLFKATVEAGVQDLGVSGVDARTTVAVDLNKAGPLILPRIPLQGEVKGEVEMDFRYVGRLPEKGELERLASKELPLAKRLGSIRFFENLELSAALKGLGVDLTLRNGSRVKASGIGSPRPLRLVLSNGIKQGEVEGKILFGKVEALPMVGRFKEPEEVTLSFKGRQKGLKTFNLSQTMTMGRLHLKESLDCEVEGIHHLLGLKGTSPLTLLLRQVEAKVHGRIKADIDEDFKKGDALLFLKGPVEADAEVRLSGGEEIRIAARFESPGLDMGIGEALTVKGLESHFLFDKVYRLKGTEERAGPGGLEVPPLSVEVLKGPRAPSRPGRDHPLAARVLRDLKGRLSHSRALVFDSARVRLGPLDLAITHYELGLRFKNGLPLVDYMEMGVMGGTMAGSFFIRGRDGRFFLEADCAFSGLKAETLLPSSLEEISGEEGEISGRLSLWLPLSQDPGRVLNSLRLTVDLNHIGSKVLERILYRMDPYESNETIVKQRKLLRMGSPRWVEFEILYGNLSLRGEVEAKGLQLELPRIERLNVADLPIHRRLAEGLSVLGPLDNLLHTLGAGGIQIGPDGTLSWLPLSPKKRGGL